MFKTMRSRIAVAFLAVGVVVISVFAYATVVTFEVEETTRAAGIAIAGGVIIVGGGGVWVFVAPRHVVGQLAKLRATANWLSHKQLPDVLARLRRGEQVDVATAAAVVEFGPDEFGDAGRDIAQLGRAAIATAVEAAGLHGSRRALATQARRTQGLARQQLELLGDLQRTIENPDVLARLFELDAMAMRLARVSKNQLIMAGEKPQNRWKHPVPMYDVLRAAAQNIASYKRVAIANPVETSTVQGHAAGDVIDILTELIENAATFSPGHTPVRVTYSVVGNGGIAVDVEDMGLGMKDGEIARYNDWMVHPPESTILISANKLGLFVVSQLAPRLDIRVELRRSPYGGTTAIVLIPAGLIGQSSTDAGGATAVGSTGPMATAAPSPQQRGTREGWTAAPENGKEPSQP